MASDVILPPVKLYKVGDIYFVYEKSQVMSKKTGVKYIDAEVIEFVTDVPLTPDMDPNEIFIWLREKFLILRSWIRARPDSVKIRVTAPGQYDALLGQINKLMVQMNEDRKADEKW